MFGYKNNKGDSQKIVEFLLSSKKIKKHCNIHTGEDGLLLHAIHDKDVKMVKFLTTSPLLKKHCNIHSQKGKALIIACENGHLPIVKFFTSSLIFKIPISPNAQKGQALEKAIINNHFYIVKYLLTSKKLIEPCVVTEKIFLKALEKNNLSIIKLLYKNGFAVSKKYKKYCSPEIWSYFETKNLQKNILAYKKKQYKKHLL